MYFPAPRPGASHRVSRSAPSNSRNPPKRFNRSRARSTADLPRTPVRKKMASNSASERLAAPRASSFSRGRSAAGQSVIAMAPPLYNVVSPGGTGSLYHMGMLTNKRVLVGVTGGIAAYKTADLIRRLDRKSTRLNSSHG